MGIRNCDISIENGVIYVAISQTIVSDTGLTIQDAYIRVHDYHCSGNTINVRLRAYINRQAANGGKSHVEGSEDILIIEGDYSENAPNTKIQIYKYAKTLNKYADAVDVLEVDNKTAS